MFWAIQILQGWKVGLGFLERPWSSMSLVAGDIRLFRWQEPRLCDTELQAEEDMCKLAFKLIVSDSILRVLGEMARALEAKVGAMDLAGFGATMRVSLEELVLLCRAIRRLLGEAVEGDPLTEMKAKLSLAVVRMCISQSQHWRELEKKSRQEAVALQTLLPEVNAMIAEMNENKFQLHPAARFKMRMVKWDEALPKGQATACLLLNENGRHPTSSPRNGFLSSLQRLSEKKAPLRW